MSTAEAQGSCACQASIGHSRASVPLVPEPFVHRLRVRYGECDPQGIVFNANYLLYFDVVFTELWRVAVGPWQDMVARGVDAVVAEANLDFRAPARFDEELQLHARIARLGASSITTEIDVLRESQLLVAGRLRHVCVDTTTWSKAEIPDWVRRGLERFAPDETSTTISSERAGVDRDGS
jgi:acyl-CoA thioester hydrolase